MTTRRKLLLSTALLCATAALVCAALRASRPNDPLAPTHAPTVPVSAQAAQRLEDAIRMLDADEFRILVSEEEATSYIALRLGDALPLADPQVRFLPDRFMLEGNLLGPVRSHLQVTGTAAAVEGRPHVEIESVRVGRVALPHALLASVADSLLEAIGAASEQIDILSIKLSEGSLMVIGRATES